MCYNYHKGDNMFDEIIIKRKLKKELTGESYSKLSYDIQIDPRIMTHLVKCDPKSISMIPSTQDVSIYVLENYDLIPYLTEEQLNACIEELDIPKMEKYLNLELYDKLDYDNQLIIFKNFSVNCIEFFDDDRKKEAARGIILAKYANSQNEIYENEYMNKYSSCKDFPDDKLAKIVLNFSIEEFQNFFESKYVVQRYIITLFLSLDDRTLTEKFPLLKVIYEELPENLKNKVDLIEAGDNLEKIASLPEDMQVIYFSQNINKLHYASDKVIGRCLLQLDELTADILLKYNETYNPSFISKLSEAEREKVLSRNFYRIWNITRDIDYQLDLDTIMYNKLSKISNTEKRKKILALYNTLEEEKQITSEEFIYCREKYQISRLLYDENIINNNSAELLTKYKETYDRNILIQILTNAYGEHVLEIFRDRPNLDLLNIDNFKTLDKKIYEKLGKNFVHHLLNCKLYILDDLIGKLTENENILNNFVQYFKCMTDDLEHLDLNTITNMMEKYIVHEELINQIDFDNISETTKQNLRLLINDSKKLSIDIQSTIDLNNYIEFRKNRYIEIANEVEYTSEMKDLIFAYIFGRSVSQDALLKTDDDILEKLSFKKALRIFNIDNLIATKESGKTKEIIAKMGLTSSEIAMLTLLYEINQQNDINVLKVVYKSLVDKNLDSVLFANTFDKIKNFYIEDIRRGLLSSSMLDTKPKTNVDGVEIVTFAGDEFTLICSTTGLNLSENGIWDQKSGEILLNDWLTREHGTNIISTALASSDTSVYPANESLWTEMSESITFVFGSDIDIIGMGASDIASEHRKRSLIHGFSHVGISGRNHGFSTMDEFKTRINRNNTKNKEMEFDDKKFQSEITITRKEEDIRKTGGGLKRTMPIAMYVIGEITPKHIETAKIFNEYYEKHGLGKFRIVRVDPRFYKGEGRIVGNNFREKGDETSGRSIR